LLTRLQGKNGDGPKLLSSHPVTADRLARMTREDQPPTAPELLTRAEWAALKRICD
jgi:predicted Zn-dependent protease